MSTHIKSDIHFQSKMLNNILISHFNSRKIFKTVSIYKGRKYIMSILLQRSSGILQSLPQYRSGLSTDQKSTPQMRLLFSCRHKWTWLQVRRYFLLYIDFYKHLCKKLEFSTRHFTPANLTTKSSKVTAAFSCLNWGRKFCLKLSAMLWTNVFIARNPNHCRFLSFKRYKLQWYFLTLFLTISNKRTARGEIQ